MHTTRKLLVVSPWGRLWSLGAGAGVSDEHHFVEGFTRAGYEVHFLLPECEGAGFRGVHLHTYPDFFSSMHEFPVAVKRLTWLPLFNAMVLPRALRLAREIRPDFVLGLSNYTTATTWACARRHGVPSGVKLFGVMDLVHTEWPALRYWFKNFEQIVAMKFPQDVWIILDDGTRGDEAARAQGVPADRIHFLPNGVNLEWQNHRYDRGSTRVRYGIPPGAHAVLFLARMVASKRPEEVIRAMPAVLARAGCEVVFVFAGDGPERAACEALARRLNVSDNARFVGTIAHDDVPHLMFACDLFVSTSSLTNMALPTCEALICGVPVVAYDVGDTGKAVRQGQTGVLVRDGDTEGLAASIVSLLNDAEGRKRMARSAARHARETLTGWEERIAMELDIIDTAIRAASGHETKRAVEPAPPP